MSRKLHVAASLVALACFGCATQARLRRKLPNSLKAPGANGLYAPILLTSNTANDTRFDVSSKGMLAFASDRSGNSDIWVRSADPSVVEWPRQLTYHSAADNSPAFSPNGKRIAFVTRRNDARGDIAVIGVSGGKVRILTDRQSADAEPCWSPDGKHIAYARTPAAGGTEQIWELNVKTGAQERLTSDGGRSPSYSPDGRCLAYASTQDGAASNIRVLLFGTGQTASLTNGAAIDAFPCWSDDGQWVCFARFSEDTDGDGKLTTEDNPSIWRVRFGGLGKTRLASETQLTSGQFFDVFPHMRGGLLYYSTNAQGNSDIAVIDADGLAPQSATIQDARKLAERTLDAVPAAPYTAIVALRRMIADFADSPERGQLAWARLQIADQYAGMNRRGDAKKALRQLLADYPDATNEVALAKIQLAVIQVADDRQITNEAERSKRLTHAVKQLEQVANTKSLPDRIRAMAWLRAGDAYDALNAPNDAKNCFQRIVDDFADVRAICAEARMRKADIARGLQAGLVRGKTSVDASGRKALIKIYLDILRQYRDVRPVCQKAARSALELILQRGKGVQDDLRRIIKDYAGLPVLPAMANNRLADLYYQQDERARAKDEYRKVASGRLYPDEPEQIAAAKFALARVLYEDGDYKKCLGIYAQLTKQERRGDIEIFTLARRAYVRSTLDKAHSEFETRDIAVALKTYRGLMDFDWDIVEAHRGYIECHDVLDRAARRKGRQAKLIDKVIRFYQKAVKAHPADPVAHYGLGLAYTYLDPPAFDKAKREIVLATGIDPRVSYFHQTLGWIHEQQYRKDKRTLWLQKAISQYQVAASLTDAKDNPRGRADLLLNLGNAYLKLGNMGKAREYYAAREASAQPFRRTQTEARFYDHYGGAASRLAMPDYDKAAALYAKALAAVDRLPGDQNLWRAQLWAKRGLSSQEGRRYQQAIQAFDNAQRLYVQLRDQETDKAKRADFANKARLHLRNMGYNTFKLAKTKASRGAMSPMLARALDAYVRALGGLEPKSPAKGKNGDTP